VRKRNDARHLRAGCARLLLRVLGDELRSWSVQRRGRFGIVLHERLHDWDGSVFFEHEPWDMRPRGQWLHGRRKPRSLFGRAGLRALRQCLLRS
jgi:hypothetical protein